MHWIFRRICAPGLLLLLTACNLPGSPASAPALATDAPPVTLSTASPTPAPEAWFIDLQSGASLAAELHPASGLPRVTTRVGLIQEERIGRSPGYLALDADGIQVARIDMAHLEQVQETEFAWTAWHGNGPYRLTLYKFNRTGRVLSRQEMTVQVTGIPEQTASIRERFVEAYQQYFGLALSDPVFLHYNNENPEESEWNQWISTAYIGDSLYVIYFYDESDVLGTMDKPLNQGLNCACRPAGRYRVLVVVVDYGNTGIDPQEAMDKVSMASQEANQRWVEFSSQAGLTEPILALETSVVFAPAPPVPGQVLTAAQVLALTGQDPARFDILAEVDLDFNILTAHSYGGGGVALMNACRPEGSQGVNMLVGISSAENLPDMARALFDHELIHIFGWAHTWPDGDGSAPAQLNQGRWFPYALFGWTDSDQDGNLEILSEAPYGYQP